MTEVILQKLSFSNMFSYGLDNTIDLTKNQITQLSASNGTGKSSVAIIIQELLFNKNVKGIKKGDIVNRWSKSKNWEGSIDFSANSKQYKVSVNRTGAQTKVILLEDSIDISEHKVLDTYKKIQEIIGSTFEIFSQLTYQSSTDLLDFLKATDTNRKKFLITLFNLEKYLLAGDLIKNKSNEIDKELISLQGELKSIVSFLDNTSIPEPKEEIEVRSVNKNLIVKIKELTDQIQNINETCKKIDKNNMYISERDSIVFDISITKPEPITTMEIFQALKLDLVVLKNEISKLKNEHKNIRITDKCSSCGQPIDNSHIAEIKKKLEVSIEEKQKSYDINLHKAEYLDKEITIYQNQSKKYENNQTKINRFEQLTQLIDISMPTEYPNFNELQVEKRSAESKLKEDQMEFDKATAYNKSVSAHNAKVLTLIEQKEDFLIRQQILEKSILIKSSQVNSFAILKKAFSTSGIVAYKLENLTKELENTINSYLSVLSDGQFQVEFSLDKEKLNINVINNGISSSIETVSGGEFSRIQTAILLAIRKLLSKLGGSSINLLFLDEITGVLDEEGKEKLLEVLQQEEGINVYLISHDFSHPLVSKVNIIKENNISYIQ